VFESQGRFADCFNIYADQLSLQGVIPIIPGMGIAKDFKNSYDFSFGGS
jgi:hypothetical protein